MFLNSDLSLNPSPKGRDLDNCDEEIFSTLFISHYLGALLLLKKESMVVKKRFVYLAYLILVPLLVLSCNKKSSTVLPPVTDTTTASGIDTSIVRMFNNTPVILWMEASANFSRLGTADKMATVFQKIVDMGVKGVVVDVKGITGLVSYNSSIAERLKTWNGYTQAAEFDYLQNVITEAKKKGSFEQERFNRSVFLLRIFIHETKRQCNC